MREILFRGKRVLNGQWVKGDFCGPCNIVFTDVGYDECLKCNDVPIVYDCEVLPETVGQYTGMVDRNGTKIFEHDIMKFTDDGEASFYLVKWSECKYIVEQLDDYQATDDLDRFFCDNAVVVGNKFDWKPEV